MKFLTWNVDGLCGEATYDRTQKSLEIIISQAPDLLFLQEVIPITERIYSVGLKAKGYICAVPPPRGAPYFTMCYYNPATITPLGEGTGGERLQFTGDAKSRMGRDILQLWCQYKPRQQQQTQHHGAMSPPLMALNSHLESEKASSGVRTAQLAQLAQLVHDLGNNGGVAIIAGDLNMRDKEAKAAILAVRERTGDPSFDLNDAYDHFGKPKPLSKTWIMPGKPSVGCRFDRVYHSCHTSSSGSIEFLSLQHIGTKVIPAIGMTPSDHFGLVLALGLQRPCEGAGALPALPAGLVLGSMAAEKTEMKSKSQKRKAEEQTSLVSSNVEPSFHTGLHVSNPSAKKNKFSSNYIPTCSVEGRKNNSEVYVVGDNGNHEEEEKDADDEDLQLALKLSMEQTSSSSWYNKLTNSFQNPHPQKNLGSEGVSLGVTRNSSSSSSSSSNSYGRCNISNASSTEKERRREGFLKGLEKRSGSLISHPSTSSGGSTSAGCDASDSNCSDGHAKSRRPTKTIEVIELSD